MATVLDDAQATAVPLSLDDPNAEGRHARQLAGWLGPVLRGAMEDDDVTEAWVNSDGRIWMNTLSRQIVRTSATLDVHFRSMFLNRVATAQRTTLDALHASLEAELPEEIFRGARLQGEIPPITRAPSFNIRKHSKVVLSLDQLEAQGMLTRGQKRVIRDLAVPEHWNVVVCGWTDSGKTFLLKSILKEITAQFPMERILTLEDTLEIICESEDHESFKKARNGTMADLVMIAMRRKPRRIVVGEVRDGSCLAMLDAWTTHEGGVATVHAKTVEGCLDRMDRMCMRNRVPSDAYLIAEAVQLVILVKGDNSGRRVRDMAYVEPRLDGNGRYILRHFTEEGELQ